VSSTLGILACLCCYTAANRDYKTFGEFRREVIKFLRHTVPKQWKRFCDRITDNFRLIHRADFQVLA